MRQLQKIRRNTKIPWTCLSTGSCCGKNAHTKPNTFFFRPTQDFLFFAQDFFDGEWRMMHGRTADHAGANTANTANTEHGEHRTRGTQNTGNTEHGGQRTRGTTNVAPCHARHHARRRKGERFFRRGGAPASGVTTKTCKKTGFFVRIYRREDN